MTLRDHKAPSPQTKMKNKPTTKTVVTDSSSDPDVSDNDGDIALDEAGSVDEELPLHQKVEVDDKVHNPHLLVVQHSSDIYFSSSPSNKFVNPFNWTHHSHGQRLWYYLTQKQLMST